MSVKRPDPFAIEISQLFAISRRRAISTRPLSPEDLDWFQRSMGVGYRDVLVGVVLVGCTAAAFCPIEDGW